MHKIKMIAIIINFNYLILIKNYIWLIDIYNKCNSSEYKLRHNQRQSLANYNYLNCINAPDRFFGVEDNSYHYMYEPWLQSLADGRRIIIVFLFQGNAEKGVVF